MVIDNIGKSAESGVLFRATVPSPDYRAQCLQHASSLGIGNVLYAVGRSGTIANGGIVYVCLLNFTSFHRSACIFTLDCVDSATFQWVRKDQKNIPKEYDQGLKESFASDIYDFSSYY